MYTHIALNTVNMRAPLPQNGHYDLFGFNGGFAVGVMPIGRSIQDSNHSSGLFTPLICGFHQLLIPWCTHHGFSQSDKRVKNLTQID